MGNDESTLVDIDVYDCSVSGVFEVLPSPKKTYELQTEYDLLERPFHTPLQDLCYQLTDILSDAPGLQQAVRSFISNNQTTSVRALHTVGKVHRAGSGNVCRLNPYTTEGVATFLQLVEHGRATKQCVVENIKAVYNDVWFSDNPTNVPLAIFDIVACISVCTSANTQAAYAKLAQANPSVDGYTLVAPSELALEARRTVAAAKRKSDGLRISVNTFMTDKHLEERLANNYDNVVYQLTIAGDILCIDVTGCVQNVVDITPDVLPSIANVIVMPEFKNNFLCASINYGWSNIAIGAVSLCEHGDAARIALFILQALRALLMQPRVTTAFIAGDFSFASTDLATRVMGLVDCAGGVYAGPRDTTGRARWSHRQTRSPFQADNDNISTTVTSANLCVFGMWNRNGCKHDQTHMVTSPTGCAPGPGWGINGKCVSETFRILTE